MISFVRGFFTFPSAFFRSRHGLSLEIVALRQQLKVISQEMVRVNQSFTSQRPCSLGLPIQE